MDRINFSIESYMTLRNTLIVLTMLTTIADTSLLPFYPQFFSLAFGVNSPEHVGLYAAFVAGTGMAAYQFWTLVGKYVDEFHLWICTQVAAFLLGIYCYFTEDVVYFWLASLIMLAFKTSYYLIYPYLMKLGDDESHVRIIGQYSVILHVGAIIGAALGGIVLQEFNAKDIFLLMAGSDLLQVLIFIVLIFNRKKNSDKDDIKKRSLSKNQSDNYSPMKSESINLLRLAIVSAALYFSIYLIRPFFSSYWQSFSKYEGEFIAGLIYVIPAFISIICLVTSKDGKSNNYKKLFDSLIVSIVGVFLISFENELSVIAGRITLAYALYHVFVRLDSILFEISDKSNYSKNFAKMQLVTHFGIIISGLVAGFIVENNSYYLLFMTSFLVTILSLILYFTLFKAKILGSRS